MQLHPTLDYWPWVRDARGYWRVAMLGTGRRERMSLADLEAIDYPIRIARSWTLRVLAVSLIAIFFLFGLWLAAASGTKTGVIVGGAIALFTVPFMILRGRPIWLYAGGLEVDRDGFTLISLTGHRRHRWSWQDILRPSSGWRGHMLAVSPARRDSSEASRGGPRFLDSLGGEDSFLETALRTMFHRFKSAFDCAHDPDGRVALASWSHLPDGRLVHRNSKELGGEAQPIPERLGDLLLYYPADSHSLIERLPLRVAVAALPITAVGGSLMLARAEYDAVFFIGFCVLVAGAFLLCAAWLGRRVKRKLVIGSGSMGFDAPDGELSGYLWPILPWDWPETLEFRRILPNDRLERDAVIRMIEAMRAVARRDWSESDWEALAGARLPD